MYSPLSATHFLHIKNSCTKNSSKASNATSRKSTITCFLMCSVPWQLLPLRTVFIFWELKKVFINNLMNYTLVNLQLMLPSILGSTISGHQFKNFGNCFYISSSQQLPTPCIIFNILTSHWIFQTNQRQTYKIQLNFHKQFQALCVCFVDIFLSLKQNLMSTPCFMGKKRKEKKKIYIYIYTYICAVLLQMKWLS